MFIEVISGAIVCTKNGRLCYPLFRANTIEGLTPSNPPSDRKVTQKI